MANKRMFSKQITSSDAFMDMPATSQLLYFHLNMEADDDGFVGNPKRIIRMISAGEDDFKILVAKRFILSFESGIVVIKHWLIHNLIRGDRYTETTYKIEKSTLGKNEYGAYTEKNEDTIFKEVKKIEKPKWKKLRQKIMKESNLPDSFDYKIRQAFVGKICPICKNEMRELPVEKLEYNSKSQPRPSIQHNIPISKGGKHELGNISVVCHSCNISTGNNETEELNAKEVSIVWNEIIGNQSATSRQHRLGKVRLGKVRLEDTSEKSDAFDRFYEKYPKKELKKKAKEIWKRKKLDTYLENILLFVENAQKTDRWLKGYVKSPPAFLNGECWNDNLESYNDKKIINKILKL